MSATTDPTTDPKDPDEELTKKQLKLQGFKDEIVRDTQSANSLQSDITALQTKIAEVKPLLGGYKPDKLKSDLVEANKVIITKIGIAEAALKDKKAAIDAAIEKFFKELKDQENAVHTALTDSTTAADKVKPAEVAEQAAQLSYEKEKKIPDTFDAWSKDIKDLLDQASMRETQSDYGALYFLAKEAGKVADKFKEPPIPLYEDYKKSLDAKLLESQSARENANDKRADADRLLKNYNDKKRAYDTAYASRRTNLLKTLDELKKEAEKK